MCGVMRGLAMFLVVVTTGGQDMRGACVGCGDVFRHCEMGCLLPLSGPHATQAWPINQPEQGSEIDSCRSMCKRAREDCTETEAATNCFACVETCVSTYTEEMQACLLRVSPLTTLTFGKNLDACSVSASSRMDTCSEKCYGNDGYFGWTPETEEGVEKSMERFTIPSYLAALQQAREVEPNFQQQSLLRATPSSRKGTANAKWIPGPWYLHASGAIGVVMVVAGIALERYALQR